MRNGIALILVCALLVQDSQSQDVGYVWEPPPSLAEAKEELRTIASIGATAVRTPVLYEIEMFRLADSLGIRFYQELPVRYRTTTELVEASPTASSILRSAIGGGGNYRSSDTFGLAYMSNTSHERACAYFNTLAEIGRSIRSDVRLYYTTPFLEEDACKEYVDFRLASTISAGKFLKNDSVAGWPADLGFAGVGTHYDPDSFAGLRSEGSEEFQARYLEEILTAIDAVSNNPPALFVYRWRDQSRTSEFENDLFDRKFGVTGTDGSRAARDVTRGFFQGNQKVFAFDAGEQKSEPIDILVLLSWLIIASLVVVYVLTPRVQAISKRYFVAHGFYCSAVAEGRENTPLANASLVALAALSFSVIGASAIAHTSYSAGFDILTHRLPDFPRWLMLKTSSLSVLTIAVIAAVFFAIVLIQGSFLSFMSGRGRKLSPMQAVQLQIWPKWHLVVLMLLTVSLFSPAAGYRSSSGIILSILLVISILWSTGRAAYDYYLASRQTAGRALLVTVLSPTFLLIALCLVILVRQGDTIQFLYDVYAQR